MARVIALQRGGVTDIDWLPSDEYRLALGTGCSCSPSGQDSGASWPGAGLPGRQMVHPWRLVPPMNLPF
jgi:hypothetical protein